MSAEVFRRPPRQAGPPPPGPEMLLESRDYLRFLAQQRTALLWRHPEPEALAALAGSPRMWERRSGDPDFAEVRVAVDGHRLPAGVVVPENRPGAAGPLPGLPVAVRLRDFRRLLLRGDREPVGGLARALLAQLATLHAPDELRIAVVAAPERRAGWDWVLWLPHTHTGPAGGRLVFDTMTDLDQALATEAAPLVVVLDGAERSAGIPPSMTVVELSGPPSEEQDPRRYEDSCALLRLDVTPSSLTVDAGHWVTALGRPDTLSMMQAEQTAQQIALNRLAPPGTAADDRPPVSPWLVAGDAPPSAGDGPPVFRGESPVLTEGPPLFHGVSPVLTEGPPLFHGASPVTTEGTPLFHGASPAVGGSLALRGESPGLRGESPGLWGEPAARGAGPAAGRHPDPGPTVSPVPAPTVSPLSGPPVGQVPAPPVTLVSGPPVRPVPAPPRRVLRNELPDLLGFDDLTTIDPLIARKTHTRHRIPIGAGPDGAVVEIDLDTMGPHGLIVGATGSGKSELLRTVVTTLAVTHPAADVNVVLIDHRGSATFEVFAVLPHTGAVVGHSDEPSAAARLRDALDGELARRQRAVDDGVALPALLVICDEFTELIQYKPDLLDLFARIGRSGAALGVHLLLAVQRLDEGSLRGLEAHLSYRIALRTLSAADSRLVLGVPDAYDLPALPGTGLLKAGDGSPVPFQATYVSGPAGDGYQPYLVVEEIVDLLADDEEPAHQVWLPPLTAPPALGDLLGDLRAVGNRGLVAPGWAGPGRLAVPLGVVDLPFEQRRDPLVLEVGNLAVAGGPQSGKSTLLRTLIGALALTRTPREVAFFCLDFGGGGLRAFDGLPHLSGVAASTDRDTVRRVVLEVAALVGERSTRSHGADPYGEVFLIVDGWATLRREFEELEEVIVELALRGPGTRVHVVVTANRWSELHPAMQPLFGTRLELRLADAGESVIDRRAAADVPPWSPGRGLTPDRRHFHTALPRIDGSADTDDITDGVTDLTSRVKAAWPGEPAPRVRLLPALVPAADLAGVPGLPLGLDEADLSPVALDPFTDRHLLIIGDGGCGKTNVLRLIARAVAATHSLAEARLVLVDYRRGLRGAIEGEHLLVHATTSQHLADNIESIHAAMSRRLPGPDVTAEQLRDRSWWNGPDLYVLVDDYDLVAAGGVDPLGRLSELLPYAHDIGLHLIIARRAGGAGRARYEPLLHQLRELSAPTLIMSGDPGEGRIIGNVRPGPQPPGRGCLVRGDEVTLVQTAWSDPDVSG